MLQKYGLLLSGQMRSTDERTFRFPKRKSLDPAGECRAQREITQRRVKEEGGGEARSQGPNRAGTDEGEAFLLEREGKLMAWGRI